MGCICTKHEHQGPQDVGTENCVVDGCDCHAAPAADAPAPRRRRTAAEPE